MKLILSSYSQAPIYEQIRQQLQEMILNGTLAPDEQLPSIRVLAAQLNVGIITVKRAYEDLENAQFIYNRQGKGCFVRPFDEAQTKQEHIKMMRKEVQDCIKKSKSYAIEKEELILLLEEEWRALYECD